MFQRSPRSVLIAGCFLLVVLVVALLTALPFRPATAQSRDIMEAPACQCSKPTNLLANGPSVVHCVCGPMSCVIALPAIGVKEPSQLQCVK
ncbi:hypothetical protein [Hydrogenophaga sp.]|uniref:hypothetical protein n=1 Tax=Hydrogenophaga sp. TaxID=1904254 RepID=UPI002724C916|nr:hypothetical protein [Hydrogenophaga sp.]MDO9437700.1 hypothetical protein [Hydrogenophaga sp.]